MIIFIAFSIFTFDCSSALIFLTNKTFIFESLLFDVLNAFYADVSILLLEIAFRNPYRAHIMNPYVMADWNLGRICRFDKIIVVTFFLFFTSLSNNSNYSLLFFFILWLSFYFNFLFRNVFLFLLVVWTFFGVFIISWIRFLEEIDVNMNICSFHCSSLNITKWTR